MINNNETAGKACTEKENKYRKQPERYVQYALNWLGNYVKRLRR
jgi:hypothetical protein